MLQQQPAIDVARLSSHLTASSKHLGIVQNGGDEVKVRRNISQYCVSSLKVELTLFANKDIRVLCNEEFVCEIKNSARKSHGA
jgi:hypothetical protein